LSDAARKGRTEILQILIKKGASVNVRAGDTGVTPLHLAGASGDGAAVRLLLANGANRAARDTFGATPLEQAAKLHRTEVVEALLPPGSGSRIDLLTEAVIKGHADLVKVLLERGTDANVRNASGATPLHDAALKGQTEVARVLVEHGADVKAKNTFGATPLHDAALGGNPGIVDLLLGKGAEVNARDDSGATPLYQAAAWGRLEVVDVLLRKGADVGIRNRENLSPMEAAIANGHDAIAARLRHSRP
jgi:ankyrin repeat protein